MSLHKFLSYLKEDNLLYKYIWLKTRYGGRKRKLASVSDIDCINNLYKGYCGQLPNLEVPLKFCDKMQMMSYCKHAIIINSSFSWWGAYFIENSEEIIISPWLSMDTTHHC